MLSRNIHREKKEKVVEREEKKGKRRWWIHIFFLLRVGISMKVGGINNKCPRKIIQLRKEQVTDHYGQLSS